MVDPIHIPLSPLQVAWFASITAEQGGLVQRSKELTAIQSGGVTALIRATVDPASIPSDWRIDVGDGEIVITPPPAPLELVKEA